MVGAAEADEIGIVPHKSALQLHAEAATNALAHANLGIRDVDALFTCGIDFMPGLLVAEYLGLPRRSTAATPSAGRRSSLTCTRRCRRSAPVRARSR